MFDNERAMIYTITDTIALALIIALKQWASGPQGIGEHAALALFTAQKTLSDLRDGK